MLRADSLHKMLNADTGPFVLCTFDGAVSGISPLADGTQTLNIHIFHSDI
jgi:hypothetical protein